MERTRASTGRKRRRLATVNGVITAEVWSAVVRFSGESGRPGSAFMSQLEPGRWVLVTAKHLCNEDSEELVTLVHPYTDGGAPIQVGLQREFADAPVGDIALFRLPEGTLTQLHPPIPLSTSGLAFTQDAYIMGYPYRLTFPLDEKKVFPIVKRGIVCAERYDEDGHQVLVIDMIANPGFSGGPLVYRRHDTNAWAFAGAVQQSLLAPVVQPTDGVPDPPMVPSGLSLVASAGQIQ